MPRFDPPAQRPNRDAGILTDDFTRVENVFRIEDVLHRQHRQLARTIRHEGAVRIVVFVAELFGQDERVGA